MTGLCTQLRLVINRLLYAILFEYGILHSVSEGLARARNIAGFMLEFSTGGGLLFFLQPA